MKPFMSDEEGDDEKSREQDKIMAEFWKKDLERKNIFFKN